VPCARGFAMWKLNWWGFWIWISAWGGFIGGAEEGERRRKGWGRRQRAMRWACARPCWRVTDSLTGSSRVYGYLQTLSTLLLLFSFELH
jgi:hypothetical protein